jgi:CheY-like chemotaxis protein
MEAVGTLAGGIAHDFNTLLMGIQGNSSLVMMDIDPEHPHWEHLKSIETYVKAGADLTKQLLGAARGGKYEVQPTDLNQLVSLSADLFGRTRKEISVHKHLQEGLWPVEVDQGQIEQVLLNLFVNASHAMPGGGHLYLESRNLTLDEDYVEPYGITPGRYAKLSVTDTGTGIDPKDQKRIFDPFFSTRPMSRGTGLGLASTYGILANHGGVITVYSEKGIGSTFNIYLPATQKAVAAHKEPKTGILSGSETILFVDDEKGVREVGRLLLERLGYRVIVATGGNEAVNLFSRHKETIDLVMLDMIMPGMSGGETFTALKQIDADVKVLLSSGYSINGQAQGILDQGCQGFIQKPFGMKELSIKLRQLLDAGE